MDGMDPWPVIAGVVNEAASVQRSGFCKKA